MRFLPPSMYRCRAAATCAVPTRVAGRPQAHCCALLRPCGTSRVLSPSSRLVPSPVGFVSPRRHPWGCCPSEVCSCSWPDTFRLALPFFPLAADRSPWVLVHRSAASSVRRRGGCFGQRRGLPASWLRVTPRPCCHALDVRPLGCSFEHPLFRRMSRLPYGHPLTRRTAMGDVRLAPIRLRSVRLSTPRLRAPGSKDWSAGACAWLRRGVQPRAKLGPLLGFSPSRV